MSGRSIIGLALLGPSCAGSQSTPADRIREEFARKGSIEADNIKAWLADGEGKISQDLAEAINGKLKKDAEEDEKIRSRGVIDVGEKDKFKDAPPVYQTVIEDLRDKSPFIAQFKRLTERATDWCLSDDCKKKKIEAKRELVLKKWEATPFLSDTEKGEFWQLAFAYLEKELPFWDQTDVADSIVFGALKSVDREKLSASLSEKLLEKAKYHYEKGRKQNAWNDALGDYEKAVELAPDNAEYHHQLGLALNNKNPKEEVRALAHFQHAVELDPNNAKYHFSVGQYLLNLKKYNEALPYFQKAVGLMPTNDQYQTNLGVVLYRLGKLEEALPYFQKAVELKPDVAQWQYNAGATLKDLGRPLEALPYYQKAAELEPSKFDGELERLEKELAAEPEPAPRAAAAPKPVATPKPSGGWGF